MAGFAGAGAVDVGDCLACRICSVVAGHAIRGNTRVIENRAEPARGAMAGVTFRGGGNVVGTPAASDYTVVTRRATANDLSVIDTSRGTPRRGAMACFAQSRTTNVDG